MTHKLLYILVIVVLIIAVPIQVGCATGADANASSSDSSSAKQAKNAKGDEGDGKTGEEEEDKEEAVPVEVAVLEQGPIESVLRFSSNLEAESRVKVVSQAKRQVVELLVEEGDRVSGNQLMLRLQDDEQRSALAKVKSQLDKAKREYQNQQRLYKEQLISEEEYNNATYELEQLEISLADAERELSYTEVRAPIAGTVTLRMINLGDQVQIGQELFEIVDFDSIVARIYVPEEHLDGLRRGLTARVDSQVATEAAYSGTIARIAPIVDPKSGTVKVTIEVGAQPGLRPGMYVDVELVMATRADALLVPKRALIYDNDQMFVYRLNDESRVERVYVVPDLSDKFFVSPQNGLTAGDQIVIAGQAGLKDGALVSLPESEARNEEDKTLEASDEAEDTIERASL